ncbi:hypothetical protein RHMOL_Rhmol03G0274300 [Rhododendron molle]|uniref:Uncharacterized protein n=1 Tax=Rhododendron molle TaxID=49168 RepID=A0ACC0PIW6_RHOML|nr:hypothetical protein RHMOL_Rhmol03G0274300 [Rhododendron molle]
MIRKESKSAMAADTVTRERKKKKTPFISHSCACPATKKRSDALSPESSARKSYHHSQSFGFLFHRTFRFWVTLWLLDGILTKMSFSKF